MIPKIIHYCWFGDNPLPQLSVKCIESWRQYCPDYEIKEWNESNFDIYLNQYTKQAYEERKWAFVSDVARLHIVYNNGGIYLDTDVELLKSLDLLLNQDMYIGFESDEYINTGLGFGAVKKFHLVKKMLDIYNNQVFVNTDGTYNKTTCPINNTEVINQYGFVINNTKQSKNGITVYPSTYFNPTDTYNQVIKIRKQTFSIHHCNASWEDPDIININKKRLPYINFFGKHLGPKIFAVIQIYKKDGIKSVIKKIKNRLTKQT